MKKHIKLVALVATLLIAAAGLITFEACNKKTEMINNVPQFSKEEGIVYQTSVPDRAAYIEEFKKMMNSSEKSGNFLTVENAGAFLFDLLNYDFGNIQKDKDDILFDITNYSVNVTDGAIGLSDFSALYSQISAHAKDYYNSLDADNPNYCYILPKFVDVEATDTQATVTVKSAITIGTGSRDYHIDRSVCDCFPADTNYFWVDAAYAIEDCFNLQYPHTPSINGERWFFSTPVTVGFSYLNYSALFNSLNNANIYLGSSEMCDYLIAYMDIADTYAYNHGGLYVMCCDITPMTEDPRNGNEAKPMHHYLEVDFSTINYSGPGGPND